MWKVDIKSNLLNRQVWKYLQNLNKEEFGKIKDFINAIDDEYLNLKEDRAFLERTLHVSSDELLTKNNQLINIVNKNIEINNKLKVNKSHLKLIIDNLWEGLIVVWGDRKIIEVNTKAVLLSGIWSESLIGERYNKFLSFSYDKTTMLIEDFIENTIVNEREYSFDRNVVLVWQKSKIPIFVTFTPVKDYSSTWTACVVVFRDATNERKLDKLKNEFLSVASHELRTPMTVIKWYISLFIRGKLWNINEEQKWYLQKILNNTVHLIKMVNEMLDVTRLEAGKMEYLYSEVDIKNLLDECLFEMKEVFQAKKLDVNFSLSNVTTLTDRNKIKQVIINLLSNAYKFTLSEWTIFIKLEKIDNGKKFRLLVKDSWVGMDERDLWKLFHKFSQVWSHLNKTEKWTGLWLFISKQIVKWMWWNINVESVYWEWSTFSIILPLKIKT